MLTEFVVKDYKAGRDRKVQKWWWIKILYEEVEQKKDKRKDAVENSCTFFLSFTHETE